ncbi:diguanylate cyclase (GGDEF) domain-containing protein [Formivibrio citricus]|uniref:diguanylate cyclase n=1 Tax=Formivibrio citricus TaxID=83765 RepID=A0A1I4X7L8_9NEIS|nr:diguanylate cyclase [Formivibrio citricus]SFN21533.1 diguanylate cyclase (GGDEF) domain-containing protein [Formivibrio citricus]
MGENQPTLIYLVTCQQQQAAEISSQLDLFGFSVKVFTKQSWLLAAMHGTPPAALLVDESGLEDAPLSQALPLAAKLAKGPVLFISEPLPVVRQLELLRSGITDFIGKPFDLLRLIDRLDHLLERSHESPYRVLVVDDSETSATWTRTMLTQAGMQVAVLHNPLNIFLSLERFKPEIILMDVYMPECTGDEIAQVVRQHASYDSIPIVFLSTETSRGRQLMARSMGGDDFLVKSSDGDELIAAVSITAARYRRLRRWMTCDSLTGLLNHTHITDSLTHEIARAKAEQSPLAFAMIDIDHFKQVNDNFGHSTGDRVIKSLARLLRQHVREAAFAGRYGGEEFAVIFPDTTLIRAAQQMDYLRNRFSALDLQRGDGVFHATFSAGLARLDPGMSSRALIEAADEALYRAKAAGRNQIGLANMAVQG